MTAHQHAVVFDVNVYIDAALDNNAGPLSWPRLPARSDSPASDCIGVANDNREFTLWTSEHILDNIYYKLVEKYQFSEELAARYLDVFVEIAEATGGGVSDPPRKVHDCPDHEDNLILDLAKDCGARIIVSEDTDLTSMSPWQGIPVLRPKDFALNVANSRRQQRGLITTSTTEAIARREARITASERLAHAAEHAANHGNKAEPSPETER